jgi:hypothetical protein
MARFHSYNFGNILQIARQRPTATRVSGIRTWNETGRFIKKGEKGIRSLFHANELRCKDGEASMPESDHRPSICRARV